MSRLFLAAFLCLSASFQLSAQTSLSYLNGIITGNGEGESDEVNVIVTDSLGNKFVYGIYTGAIDFDPSSGLALAFNDGFSDDDYFLAKYDINDSLLWINYINTASGANAQDLVLDNSGHVLICGSFTNYMDPDPGNTSSRIFSNVSSEANGFFAKYNANTGQFIWVNNIGSDDTDNVLGLAVDDQDNIYASGGFSDTLDFDLGPGVFQLVPTGIFQDPYLAKYDSSGSFIWAHSFEGSGFPGNAYALEPNSKGNLVIAGIFSGTVDFDPSPSVANVSTNGGDDIFVAEYQDNGDFVRAYNLGSFAADEFGDMRIGMNDDVFVTGVFQFTADFDPGSGTFNVTSNGDDDAFLAKYDSTGTLDWAFGIGGSGNDEGRGLAVDSVNNAYFTGYFLNSVDFDPGSGTANFNGVGGDIFLASYDSTGAYRWNTAIGGTSFDIGQAVSVGTNGRINTGGRFIGTMDLDPSSASTNVQSFNGSSSVYVAGYNGSNGSFLSGFGTVDQQGGDDEAWDVITDQSGNYYVAGFFKGDVDFDAADTSSFFLSSPNGESGFIAKYNAQDQLVWAKGFIGDDFMKIDAIELDGNDNLLATGEYQGTYDFDPGTSAFTLSSTPGFFTRPDFFVLKLNPTGDFIWAKTIGGPDFDVAYDLAVDTSNSVLITGYFRNTVDFDPGPGTASLTASNRDAFLLKLNDQGDYLWAFKVGASSLDYGYAVTTDSLNNAYLGGYFRNTVDFDPGSGTANISSIGNEDGFIAKYNANGDYVWANAYGGTSNDRIWNVFYEEGHLYASGSFEGTINLAPNGSLNRTSNSGRDIFLLKADTAGNTSWGTSFGGNQAFADDLPYDMDIANGNVYLTGIYEDTVDFDPGPAQLVLTTNLASGAFLSVFDTAGTFLDAGVFEANVGLGIAANGTHIFVSGQYNGVRDLDPTNGTFNSTAFGDHDIFALRLGDISTCVPGNDTIVATNCGPFTAPSGSVFSASGIFSDTVSITPSCDSIYRLELTILPTSNDTQQVAGCYDYFDPISNSTITQEGLYTYNFQNNLGCDSIVTIDVSLDTASSSIDIIACDSFNWNLNNATYLASGVYQDTLTTATNCDSIVTLNLTLNSSSANTINQTVCDSFLWSANNITYYNSGLYTEVFTNASGCDSSLTLDLTVLQSTTNSIVQTACDTFVWNQTNISYTSSGLYFDTVVNSLGCDSIISLDLTIFNTAFTTETVTACDSYTWGVNGTTYTASGIYTSNLTTTNGCDSIVSLDLTINNSVSNNQVVTACDSYTWSANGNTYTSSGIYTEIFSNSLGCDSTETLDLTINLSSSATQTETACESYTWPVNGLIYTSSGSYNDTIVNSAGCDSVITLNLTINTPDSTGLSVSACESYTWQDNGNTYTSSGFFSTVFTNAQGCDSLVTLDLTILKADSSGTSITACKSFTWSVNSTAYDATGFYTEILSNSNGCDSIVTLDLTINNVDTAVFRSGNTLEAQVAGAQYQWLNCETDFSLISGAIQQTFTPTNSGLYAVEIRENNCVDTSRCVEVIGLSTEEALFNSEVLIFPNPTRGEWNLVINGTSGFYNIEVFNTLGAMIERFTVTEGTQTAHLLNPESGVYFVVITDSFGRKETFRLVKL